MINNLEIVYLPVTALRPYNKNARKHATLDVDNIAKSIEKYGMNDPIGIWGNKNIIVEGHGRLLACKKLGMETVPCLRLDHLTDAQRREYAIAHNATAELSKWDNELLFGELSDLDFSDFDFDFSNVAGVNVNYDETDADVEQRKREFEERMAAGENLEEDEEYLSFIEKFQPKKTTDDCYTPPIVYEAIKEWFVKHFKLDGRTIVRPFYPGGDFEKEKYPPHCVVLDNPPFSILSKICEFYESKNIDYVLFAPSLSLFSTFSGKAKYIVASGTITYENGAVVNTSFVTNLGKDKILASAELHNVIDEANNTNLLSSKKVLSKYEYPPHVATAARLGWCAIHGETLRFNDDQIRFIRALDSQKQEGKAIFGGGFILSEKAAAEKAAAEKAAAEKAAAEKAAAEKAAAEKAAATFWALSEREKEIIRQLSRTDGE